MRYAFRPLPTWPHEVTTPRRRAQFESGSRIVAGELVPGRRVPFPETMALLGREVRELGGDEILLGVGLADYDIRQDGMPRANARSVSHPGVEVSFDSRYGRLTYATDVFDLWEDNVRAIAKGLEALRAVDRWGVAKRGQQYAGFALLTARPGQEERGRLLVERYGSVRDALMATHPDTGNGEHSTDDYQAVLAIKARGS